MTSRGSDGDMGPGTRIKTWRGYSGMVLLTFPIFAFLLLFSPPISCKHLSVFYALQNV